MTELSAEAAPNRDRLTANLYCVGSMLIWAMGFPAVTLLLPVMSPLGLTAARMALAALALLPIWMILDGPAAFAKAPWRRGLLIGALGFGTGAYLLVAAQSLTDGVTVAVMAATMPIAGIALECLLDGRRLTRGLVAGLALSLLGGVLSYATGLGSLTVGLGAGATLLSVILFSWASRETVKSLAGVSPLGRTAVTLCGGALATSCAFAVSTALHGSGIQWQRIGATEIALLALYGIGSLAFSQILWILGVGRLGVGIASMHINAASFYVMALTAVTGGTWGWLQASGALIVGLGVLVAQDRAGRGVKRLSPCD